MNNEKKFIINFAIIMFRIIYILAFTIAALGATFDGFSDVVIVFAITGIIMVGFTVVMKRYRNKIKKTQSEYDKKTKDYNVKVKAIMDERHKMANEINKNLNLEIDETKIQYSDQDRNRIIKNCNTMKKNKLPYNESMKLIPFDAVVKVKTKEEIARQMIKDFIVAQKAINRLNGISDMQDPAFVEMTLKYQPGDDVYNMLSQISKGEINEVTLTQLPYLYERVNVYMWILGLASKPRQDKQCDYVFTGYTLYKYNNIDEILNNCKMKSYDEIMEFADLITRYEWAMIELSQNGQTSKKINNDSVIEQKKAMDFVTSFDSSILLKNNN